MVAPEKLLRMEDRFDLDPSPGMLRVPEYTLLLFEVAFVILCAILPSNPGVFSVEGFELCDEMDSRVLWASSFFLRPLSASFRALL